MVLWLLGYPAQALARIHEALALAQELSHLHSLAQAWCWAAAYAQLRRDVLAVHEQAETCIALSTAQGFPHWAALGTSFRGWALAMQGQGEEGMAQVRRGIAAWRATGTALTVPYHYTLLAEVCDHLGHAADGLQALAEASTLVISFAFSAGERSSIFRLLMIYGQIWGTPWCGKNSRLIPALTRGPRHITLSWRRPLSPSPRTKKRETNV
jgi:hypothetical protein